MSRRSLFACVLAAVACGPHAHEGNGPARPNILMVVIDTLRADHLPFHGYPADTAPFLTELAGRAVVFERAWSSSSWTPPAAASLFTGVLPSQHGVHASLTAALKGTEEKVLVNRIPSTMETLPEFLRALGYRTFAVSDNPNVAEEMGFTRGFERFQGFDYEGAERVTAALAGWRDEIRASEPWFVYLHLMDPHSPYHRREPWFEPPAEGASEIERKRAAYDSEIAYADAEIRKSFELLGVGRETLVVVTADHGEEFGDHGGESHLFQLYSELTRIPLLIQQPGVEPRRVTANVSLVDVLPTLRAILGAPASPQDAGRDLTPLYLAPGALTERPVLGQRRAVRAEKEFVVRGDLKLIVTRPPERFELFDLASDPNERHDLAAERPELVAELAAQLEAFRRDAPRWERELGEVVKDERERARLAELGYGGGPEEDESDGR